MNMQENNTNNADSTLFFQSRDELAKVELSKVVFFESNSNYTKVYYPNGCTLTIIASLSSIEKILNDLKCNEAKSFFRVGRFIIINTNYLFRINIIHQQLILTDGVNPHTYTLKASKQSLRKLKNLYVERAIWEETDL